MYTLCTPYYFFYLCICSPEIKRFTVNHRTRRTKNSTRHEDHSGFISQPHNLREIHLNFIQQTHPCALQSTTTSYKYRKYTPYRALQSQQPTVHRPGNHRRHDAHSSEDQPWRISGRHSWTLRGYLVAVVVYSGVLVVKQSSVNSIRQQCRL